MEVDSDWGDEEYEADWDDALSDESETVPCPECDAEVYEDAEQCPICGSYIIHSSSARQYLWKNRPLWWIVLGALGIVAVVFGLVFLPI